MSWSLQITDVNNSRLLYKVTYHLTKCSEIKFNRVTAEFEFPPFAVAEALQWDDGQLRYTLEEIDGYHGSLELLHTISSNMHLLKKVQRSLEYWIFSQASHHIISYHISSHDITSHHIISHHFASSYLILSYLILSYLISSHITSYRRIEFSITPCATLTPLL